MKKLLFNLLIIVSMSYTFAFNCSDLWVDYTDQIVNAKDQLQQLTKLSLVSVWYYEKDINKIKQDIAYMEYAMSARDMNYNSCLEVDWKQEIRDKIYANIRSWDRLYLSGDYTWAIEWYNKAFSLVTDIGEDKFYWTLSSLYLWFGEAYYKINKYKRAEEYFNKSIMRWKSSLESKPWNTSIMINVGRSYHYLLQSKEAMYYYDSALGNTIDTGVIAYIWELKQWLNKSLDFRKQCKTSWWKLTEDYRYNATCLCPDTHFYDNNTQQCKIKPKKDVSQYKLLEWKKCYKVDWKKKRRVSRWFCK